MNAKIKFGVDYVRVMVMALWLDNNSITLSNMVDLIVLSLNWDWGFSNKELFDVQDRFVEIAKIQANDLEEAYSGSSRITKYLKGNVVAVDKFLINFIMLKMKIDIMENNNRRRIEREEILTEVFLKEFGIGLEKKKALEVVALERLIYLSAVIAHMDVE
jgi:hypothetical protein